jgi:hypothetical protein
MVILPNTGKLGYVPSSDSAMDCITSTAAIDTLAKHSGSDRKLLNRHSFAPAEEKLGK